MRAKVPAAAALQHRWSAIWQILWLWPTPRSAPRSGRIATARAVGVLTVVRLRDTLGVLGGWRDGEEAADALVVEMTGDLATAINEHSSLAG